MRLAAFILGFILILAGTIGSFMLAGNPPTSLFFLPPMLAMLLIPIGCCTVAFGIRGPIVVIRSFAALFSSGPIGAKTPEATRIISASIGYVYAAGAFVFAASLVTIMARLSEVAASGLTESLVRTVAATVVSLIYPVVLAELILRPLKHRLDSLEQ